MITYLRILSVTWLDTKIRIRSRDSRDAGPNRENTRKSGVFGLEGLCRKKARFWNSTTFHTTPFQYYEPQYHEP